MELGSSTGRIVVGIDGSAPSKRALRWAVLEAICRDVGLDVVHAWTIHYSLYPDGTFVDPVLFEIPAQKVLDDAMRTLAAEGPVLSDVRPLLMEKDAGIALVQAAAGAELLVVASRGYGGFVGLLLGSVSQHCVDHAPVPVVVIPPTWVPKQGGRVVVGVDGSEGSYDALHWAIAEAARRNARLDVVNGFDFYAITSPFVPVLRVDREQAEKSSHALIEEMVSGAVGRAPVKPRYIELIPAACGAARALLETAKGADLLVVGSRGRGSVRGLVLGSVSQQCVHHAACPVVVVRPPQTQSEAGAAA